MELLYATIVHSSALPSVSVLISFNLRQGVGLFY